MPSSPLNPVLPVVAIIANSITPYRLHLHQRIVREISQVRLLSVFTHDVSNSPWLAKPGEEISPVMFGAGEPSELAAVPSRALHEWKKGGRIIRYLVEQKARFVLVNGYNDASRVRIIRWCAKNGVSCMVFGDSNIRCDRARGIRARIKGLYLGTIIRWAGGLLPCGTLGAQFFMKYGATPDQIIYMPYEPDYELIRNISAEQIESVRQRFGLDSARRRIVFSGRLVGMKRVDLLVDAFSAIAGKRTEWDLVILGDGPLRESLQARVPSDLRSRVKWTGFLDDQPAVSAMYRLSDVLVLSSENEPWAVVINEAAAAGLAIVASDVVGSAAELVRDGVNGRIFPAGDLDRLKECLLDVTDTNRTDSMKRESANVLRDWRERGDPIKGLRQALTKTGVLP